MKQQEIFKLKANSDAKHLLAKLNETEADAIQEIAQLEKKINELRKEVDTCTKKKETLRQKLNQLNSADESSWEKASNEFIESIEKLEDKNVFQTKTEEWFKTIRNTAGELKQDIKEKAAQW